MAKLYNTVDEIRDAFIKSGWHNSHFYKMTPDEIEKKFFKGFKYKDLYILLETGNIYNASGEVIYFNILPKRKKTN